MRRRREKCSIKMRMERRSGKEEIKKIYEKVGEKGQIKKVDSVINMGSREREGERDIIEKRKRVIKMEKKGR